MLPNEPRAHGPAIRPTADPAWRRTLRKVSGWLFWLFIVLFSTPILLGEVLHIHFGNTFQALIDRTLSVLALGLLPMVLVEFLVGTRSLWHDRQPGAWGFRLLAVSALWLGVSLTVAILALLLGILPDAAVAADMAGAGILDVAVMSVGFLILAGCCVRFLFARVRALRRHN